LQHNAQLAFSAQAKAKQLDTLQAALQTAIDNQAAKLAAIEQERPAWPASKQARTARQNQLAQAKARLAHSNADSKGWGRSPGTPASTQARCSTSSPLVNCVSITQASPANGTLYSNSNAKPLFKRFDPLRENSTWVELAS
jgi:hypothetical protein